MCFSYKCIITLNFDYILIKDSMTARIGSAIRKYKRVILQNVLGPVHDLHENKPEAKHFLVGCYKLHQRVVMNDIIEVTIPNKM